MKMSFKKKGFWYDQRGVISFILGWLLLITMIIFLFTFTVPFLINYNTRMYSASQVMFTDANTAASKITDSTIRTDSMAVVNNARNTITEQTESLAKYFQYSWILIIIIVTLIAWLVSRSYVERGVV